MGTQILFLLCLSFMVSSINGSAPWPPSPGYYPSKKFKSMKFYQGFKNLWGPQHQRQDQHALTLWLDRTSGNFFRNFLNIVNMSYMYKCGE